MEQLKKFKYIVCDNEKRPLHPFDEPRSYEEVKDKENLGIKLEEPYVIIDLDDVVEFEILQKLITDLNIKTRILKTTRGGHFWFKTLTPMKNVIHANTPITLKIDVKSWGKNSMEFVKKDGQWRQWLQFDEIIDDLPFFLKPIKREKHVVGYKDGDGRDTALFSYIIPLINEGLTKTQIKETFYLINNYIFGEPLKDDEIEKMFEGNQIFESSPKLFFDGRKFLHNKFADYIIKEFGVKGYGNDVFFYDGYKYTNNRDALSLRMIEVIPHLQQVQIRETHENIRLKMITKNEPINTKYVNLKNGLYNIITNEFIPHTPDIFVLNQMNCSYREDAYDKHVYGVFKSITRGDENTITLLIQMLGYMLVGDCRFQKAFILLGAGRNGKSMFLDMIRNWLGEDNCSSVALEELSERFKPVELVGKMLNIGDDSGHNLLENTAIFKKLVTGDTIMVERKNQQGFQFANKAKMIFAANSLPPTTDKSEGFFRRCIVIPFNAVYKETDAGYDPNMIDKLTTESAKEYLLQLAITGLQSLIQEKRFYIPEDSQSITDYYELSNNNILMWYQTLVSPYETYREAYSDYLLFCANNNYKAYGGVRFQQEYEKLKKGFK